MTDINHEVIEQVLIKVFDYTNIHYGDNGNWYAATKESAQHRFYMGKCNDWNFGGLVVERMRWLAFVLVLEEKPIVGGKSTWGASFHETDGVNVYTTNHFDASEETAPLAICKAALKAINGNMLTYKEAKYLIIE